MASGWRPAWRPTPLLRMQDATIEGSDARPAAWSTPSHTRWEWNDTDWEGPGRPSDPWDDGGDPWSGSTDGWLTDHQMRQFNTARVDRTTPVINGRWSGSHDIEPTGAGGRWADPDWDDPRGGRGKATEKLVVPGFDGECASEAVRLGRM